MQVSSKRIREKAEAIQEYLGDIVTLRIDEKRSVHKTPLHLNKRDAIVRECTANYVNLETLDTQKRIVHTEWAPGDQEDKVVSLFPGRQLSLPLEDVKVARDMEKKRLMIIISRDIWDIS